MSRNKPDVPCAGCGKLIYGGSRGSLPPGRSTCQLCRRERSLDCRACGQSFVPANRGRTTCSDECARERVLSGLVAGSHGRPSEPERKRICEVCSVPYKPTCGTQRTCGRICGAQINGFLVRARSAPPKARPEKICAHCDHQYSGSGYRYCSLACARAAKAVYDLAYNLSRSERAGARICVVPTCRTEVPNRRRSKCDTCLAQSRQEAKRRERRRVRNLRDGAASEYYTLAYIAERDRFMCGLCRKRVAMTQLVPHPKSPTIDHILPRACGGDDVKANVQLAHFICNTRKRAGGMQQLLLIG